MAINGASMVALGMSLESVQSAKAILTASPVFSFSLEGTVDGKLRSCRVSLSDFPELKNDFSRQLLKAIEMAEDALQYRANRLLPPQAHLGGMRPSPSHFSEPGG